MIRFVRRCVNGGGRVAAAAGALVLLVGMSTGRAHADTLIALTALVNGAQEVPPNTSPSQGVAFLTLNTKSKELCYSISFSALSGTELLAHFHGPVQPGQNGGVLFDITGGNGPSPVGNSKWGCVGPLDRSQSRDLLRGLWYINVHSSTYPAGEIRGQVLPNVVKYRRAQPIGSPSGAFLDELDQ